MTKQVHGAFKPEQREERHREVKRRHAAAQQQAKAELARRYPAEYSNLWRSVLEKINADKGPLPHQEVAEAHETAQQAKAHLLSLRKALKTVEGLPGMEDAADRLRKEIEQATA